MTTQISKATSLTDKGKLVVGSYMGWSYPPESWRPATQSNTIGASTANPAVEKLKSPQDQITSAIANENWLSKLKKVPPKTVLKTPTQITKLAVILTLYFRDGSASGPIIPGAQVVGQDASGNSFQETADSRGYVTIAGDPGTWSFTASADGYKSNSWAQGITETDTKDAFLQKEKSSTEGSAEPQQQKPIASTTPFILTIYVHDGDQNGPAIMDAEITGQDGSGESFQQTTDSSGSVIISGNPGTWSFSASAFGYQTKSWSQSISDTCDRHEYLQQVQQQQESVPTTTQQGSESSVVGKWRINQPNCIYGKSGHDCASPRIFTFKEDGTYTNDAGAQGNWLQYGDTVRFLPNEAYSSSYVPDGSQKWDGSQGGVWETTCYPTIWEGVIKSDTMNGGFLWSGSCDQPASLENTAGLRPPIGPEDTWSAVRIDTGDSENQ